MQCTSKCSKTTKVMKTLVWIGGLNWGLVGIGGLFALGNWNVVNLIFGGLPWLENIIYILVGVCAVLTLKHCSGKCNKGSMSSMKDGGMMGNTGGMDHHDMNN
ncbi:DUF378 domain-containing protein [Patescibacteria group bacterium]|nr:DUF378 domain-containing protein [Patescibacteria group bacterium]